MTLSPLQETDWRVLLQVLNGLAKVLENKNLLLASSANLDRFCGTLCSMVRISLNSMVVRGGVSYSILYFVICKLENQDRAKQ